MGEAQETLGLFSNIVASSINIGDDYVKKTATKVDPRTKGKQFLTAPLRLGKTTDVTFNRFTSLAVGEPYIEMAIHIRRERNENLKKQIGNKPFRPSSPSKRSTGHGTHYGTFNRLTNMKTTDEYDKRPAQKRYLDLPKNFLTSPPKRGTYGMIGTNIGGKPEGINGEYAYSSEPPKGRPSTAPDKMKPFVPSSPSQKGTYGFQHLNINGIHKPHGAIGEYTYQADPIPTTRSHKADTDALKPFRPSNPPQRGRGFYGTFRWSGQDYQEDPGRLRAQCKRETGLSGVFRPSSRPKSVRQPSIANHPRNQDGGHPAAVNARLFAARLAGGAGPLRTETLRPC